MSGHVGLGTVDAGSKSERDAVTLKTDDGSTYVLRQDGAPAFGDRSLEPLIGGNVLMHCIAIGNVLVVKGWSKRD